MTNTKILLPFFILLTLLTIFSFDIPFFWDSTFFSGLSIYFYENGMNGFIAPESFDTGGFPLYSTYLTTIWKCFGKTLVVSHIAMLPFLFGLIYEFFILAKRYLNDKTIFLALTLLMLEPVFITQSMLMGYDIIIAYFFLIALNAIYNKRTSLFSLSLLLLCLISIRGIMLAGALFSIDLLHNRKITIQLFKKYIPAILSILFWTLYHKQQTGWYIFSPLRENNAEQFSEINMMLRQFIYILWKNVDMGRIALWMIFAFFSLHLIKKIKSQQHKEILRNVFVPLAILTVFMIVIKNPIGHKYFLVVFCMLIIATCYFIQHIEKQSMRRFIFMMLAISLIAGNFIIYPQRYGNAWDSSLKAIPFFPLEQKMRTYIKSKQIDFKTIGTQFPLTNDLKSATLADTPNAPYTDIETNAIHNYTYFLYSNIINSGRMDDIESVQKNWIVEKEMRSGMIELILYKNPNF